MRGLCEEPAGTMTVPQSELLLHGDHAALIFCGFIALRDWSMIDIIQSGKRKELPSDGNEEDEHA